MSDLNHNTIAVKTLMCDIIAQRPVAWLLKTVSQFVTSLVSAVMLVLVMF